VPRKITKSMMLLLMAALMVSSLGYVYSINLSATLTPIPKQEQVWLDISIISPTEDSTTSNNLTVTFIVAVNTMSIHSGPLSFSTNIDGKNGPYGYLRDPPDGYNRSTSYGEFNLTNLVAGSHKLTLQSFFIYYTSNFSDKIGVDNNKTVSFTVDAPNMPKLVETQLSTLSIILGGAIAGTVIVAVALLVIYRKHSLKLKKGNSTEKNLSS
jgi:hypothetical protein